LKIEEIKIKMSGRIQMNPPDIKSIPVREEEI